MLQKIQSNFGTLVAGAVTLFVVIKLVKDIKNSSKMLSTVANLIMLYVTAKKGASARRLNA